MNKNQKNRTIDVTLLGNRVRQRREALDYSRETFAEKIDCSTTFLAELEHGRKSPSLETLYYIALELGVSTDYLLSIRSFDCFNLENKAEFREKVLLFDEIIEDLSVCNERELGTALGIIKAYTKGIK